MKQSLYILSAISNHIFEIVNLLIERQIEENREEELTSGELNNSSENQHLDSLLLNKNNVDNPKKTDNLDTSMNILIVSNNEILTKLETFLNDTKSTKHQPQLKYLDLVNIKITTLDNSHFLQASYDTRYDLGCYIDPNCISNIHSMSTDSKDNYSTDNNPTKNDSDNSNTTLNKVETVTMSERLKDDVVNNDTINIVIKLRDLFAQQSLIMFPPSKTPVNLNPYGYEHNKIEISNDSEDVWELSAWHFNLYDYKKRPDWLNAKYWANPENFDKYRW